MNKAVFLDRDGTINVDKDYLYQIKDFEFLPGSVKGMKLLQKAGFKLIIITNQSGIARGFYSENDYEILTEWMINELTDLGIRIDMIYYCPHHPEALIDTYRKKCECRKPNLGLFNKAIEDFNLDISKCYAIGDKIRDCCICEKTECRGFLIGNNEKQKTINMVKNGKIRNVRYVSDLLEAAETIVNESCKK